MGARPNRHLSKEEAPTASVHLKSCPGPRSSGERRGRPQRGTATHLPEGPRSKISHHHVLARMRDKGTPPMPGGSAESRWPLWKVVRQFLTQLNGPFPQDPGIALFSIGPEPLKSRPHQNSDTNVYSSLTFHSQTWEQPRRVSAGECVDELWSIQTMEYWPLLERKEPSSHERT